VLGFFALNSEDLRSLKTSQNGSCCALGRYEFGLRVGALRIDVLQIDALQIDALNV
jgi:hypothetical protein